MEPTKETSERGVKFQSNFPSLRGATPTVKLPSYAECLKAEIKPQNYLVLKQYYELAAKDPKIAKLNKDNMFKLKRKEAKTLRSQQNHVESQESENQLRSSF